MRIMLILLFFSFCQIFASNSYSQTVKVSVKAEKMMLTDVFSLIERQSEFLFFYVDADVEHVKVDLNVKNKSIDEILKDALQNTSLSCTINGRNVNIMKKNASTQQQSRLIKGVVQDEAGIPVIGANVMEKNSSNGTITDLDGAFSLQVSEGASLVISYIGYISRQITVSGRNTILVNLKEDSQMIDEVVVVGYGVQRKVNLTGAVSQIGTDAFENRPITNITQALQGLVPNLNVSFENGSPDSDGSLNIRGTGSFNKNGAEPLVLVDGVQMRINMVNPEDVESVSVLKDAASAAIYGARGAFGVILITTKSGKKDRKPTIEYSGSVQFNTHTYLPDLLSAYDYVLSANEASLNQTGNIKYTDEQVEWVRAYNEDPENNPVYHTLSSGKIFWNGGNNNYQQMLQKWSPTHKHTVSMSGARNR